MPLQKRRVRPIIRAKEMFSDTTVFVFSAKRKSFPSTVKSLFQPLERTFHLLECTFHRLERMFHQLEHNFCKEENTFITLSYNNLSTMCQKLYPLRNLRSCLSFLKKFLYSHPLTKEVRSVFITETDFSLIFVQMLCRHTQQQDDKLGGQYAKEHT